MYKLEEFIYSILQMMVSIASPPHKPTMAETLVHQSAKQCWGGDPPPQISVI